MAPVDLNPDLNTELNTVLPDSSAQSWRDRLHRWLDDLDTTISWGINLFLLGAILTASATFVAETFMLRPAIAQNLRRVDQILAIIFAVEYGVRWWASPNRWRYPLQLYSLVDLIAVVPMVIGGWDILFIRLLRSFRILLLLRFFDRHRFLRRLRLSENRILVRILLTLLCLLFIAAGLIYHVEHNTPGTGIHTFLDAFYFTLVTMTTVGFGDITPLSTEGRLITLLMILAGITLIPWQISDLVRHFISSVQKVNQTCPGCGWNYHDPDAHYCKRCGTGLDPSRAIPETTEITEISESGRSPSQAPSP